MKTSKTVIPDTNCIKTISTARHETASLEATLVHAIVIYNFYNPNALESLVITPDVPPFHTYTPLLTSNPFMSLFTVWWKNFSTTVLRTL